MFRLDGKKALITGSSQGIGAAIAGAYAQAGAQVFVHASRSLEKAETIGREIRAAGGKATAVVADLLDPNCVPQLYEQTGDVDILVINASIQIRSSYDKITNAEFQSQIRVNLQSPLELIQQYSPQMKHNRWGRIITIGSLQQTKPVNTMLVYAASKCGLMSYVITLAKELAPFGITVNNISPGTILTPRNDKVLADPVYRDACLAAIPCGFFGEPKDCTGLALLLASDAGRFIVGNDICCDGGGHL